MTLRSQHNIPYRVYVIHTVDLKVLQVLIRVTDSLYWSPHNSFMGPNLIVTIKRSREKGIIESLCDPLHSQPKLVGHTLD